MLLLVDYVRMQDLNLPFKRVSQHEVEEFSILGKNSLICPRSCLSKMGENSILMYIPAELNVQGAPKKLKQLYNSLRCLNQC